MKQANDRREIIPTRDVWDKDMIPTNSYYVRRSIDLIQLLWVARWAARLRAKARWHLIRIFAERCGVPAQTIAGLIRAINQPDQAGPYRVEVSLGLRPAIYVFTIHTTKEEG